MYIYILISSYARFNRAQEPQRLLRPVGALTPGWKRLLRPVREPGVRVCNVILGLKL